MRTVGIGVLMADTGEKARALQHWSDLGVIHAEADTDKKGRGRYREYAAEPYFGERKFALIASALNKLRIPLGEMRSIVDVFRGYGRPASDEITAVNKFKISFFYQALYGRGVVLVLIGKLEQEGKDVLDLHFIPAVSENTISPPPNVISRPGELPLQMIYGAMEMHESAYCLNLTKVFAPLRR